MVLVAAACPYGVYPGFKRGATEYDDTGAVVDGIKFP